MDKKVQINQQTVMKHFCCIGKWHGGEAVPAGKEAWDEVRTSQSLQSRCERIKNGEDNLKSLLPVWTPRCAEFKDNHRAEKDAVKVLDRRMVFDIDEKGHTDEIEAMMVERDGGRWIDIFRVLMLEESVRGGSHVCVRLPYGMDPNTAQKRFAEKIGLAVDPAVKNVAGCIYMVPKQNERFVDDEFFEVSESDCTSCTADAAQTVDASAERVGAETACPQAESSKDAAGAAVKNELGFNNEHTEAEAQNGAEVYYDSVPCSEIVEKFWELNYGGKTPRVGERHTLTLELAVTMVKACNYNLDDMKTVIPRYADLPEAEWEKILKDVVAMPRKSCVPYKLRKCVDALKKEYMMRGTGGTMQTPPPMPKRLPSLIKTLTENVPSDYKAMAAGSMFPALGALMSGVRFKYWNNRFLEPTFMALSIARMSIGKSCIDEPLDAIMKPIDEADEVSRKKEAEWKRNNPTGKKKAPRPDDICVQHISNNCTGAAFSQRVIDAERNGGKRLFTRVSELEGLKKMTPENTMDGLDYLIKCCFDQTPWGQDRVGSDSVCGVGHCRFNFIASTTPYIALQMLGKKAVCDGTLTRLDLSTIIVDDSDTSVPIYGEYDETFYNKVAEYGSRLMAAKGDIVCKPCIKLAHDLAVECNENAVLYGSEAYRVLSHRAVVIAFLKGMVLYIADGCKWSKAIADYMRWSLQYDMWCKMTFFGKHVEEALQRDKKILMENHGGTQNMLAFVEDEFTKEDFVRERAKRGYTGDVASTLRSWKKRGWIDFDEHLMLYHKTDEYFMKHAR